MPEPTADQLLDAITWSLWSSISFARFLWPKGAVLEATSARHGRTYWKRSDLLRQSMFVLGTAWVMVAALALVTGHAVLTRIPLIVILLAAGQYSYRVERSAEKKREADIARDSADIRTAPLVS